MSRLPQRQQLREALEQTNEQLSPVNLKTTPLPADGQFKQLQKDLDDQQQMLGSDMFDQALRASTFSEDESPNQKQKEEMGKFNLSLTDFGGRRLSQS